MGTGRRDTSALTSRGRRGQRVPLWILGPDKLLRPVVVKLGLSDGVSTQIEEGKLKEGDKIVTGFEFDASRTTTSTRPPGFGAPGDSAVNVMTLVVGAHRDD